MVPTVHDLAPLAIDGAVFVHLIAMAAGLGTAMFADATLAGRLSQPLMREDIASVRRAHAVVSAALAALWASGLVLVAIRTDGFQLSAMTPKLVAKLATVSLLTCTAVLMGRFALPRITAHEGRGLLELPVTDLSALAACGGLSAAGWLTALLLGSSRILETVGPEVLALSAAFVLAGPCLAVLGALSLSAWATHRQDHSAAQPEH